MFSAQVVVGVSRVIGAWPRPLRIVAAEQLLTCRVLGADALRFVQAGRDAFGRGMLAWVELSASADFDDVSRSAG